MGGYKLGHGDNRMMIINIFVAVKILSDLR